MSAESDPWLHALLLAVRAATAPADAGADTAASPGSGGARGYALLINTSFNTRGRPILNTLSEALELLRSCPELDFVLVEDWLFRKEALLSLRPLR